MIAAGRPATEEPEIGRLRARDHGAFELLMEWHYAPVRRYLARLNGNAEVAGDLAQETFLRAYLALPRLEDDSDLGAWLFRIATNLARQHHRRGQVIGWARLEDEAHGSRVMAHGAVSGPAIEDQVAREELVRRALAQLPLEYRACLLLYAWAGYTCVEIGEMVGKSADAVRMILVRARRRFRDAYGDEGEAQGRGGAGPGGRGGSADQGEGPARLAEDGGRTADDACSKIEEALTCYPRGDLGREEFTSVTRHLAECAACRQALAEVQGLYRLVQAHFFSASGREEGPAAGAAVLAHAKLALMAMEAELPAHAEVAVQAPTEIQVPMLVPVSVTRRPLGPLSPPGR